MTSPEPVVWALATPLTLDEVNLHLAALESAGLMGVVEQDGRATVYLSRCDRHLAVPGVWSPVEPQDWNATWKAGLEPVTVGDVAVIAPWHDRPAQAAIALVIEPGQAFGTGHHETTTHCLAALQEVGVEGLDVLDVGTGTGVLALAAKALGARRVVGIDTDPVATHTAAANAARNRLAIEVATGSVDVCGDERFDVVVANLTTDTVAALAPALAGRLDTRGTLVVSGVSHERVEEAVAALEQAGLHVDARPGTQWAVLLAAWPRSAASGAR